MNHFQNSVDTAQSHPGRINGSLPRNDSGPCNFSTLVKTLFNQYPQFSRPGYDNRVNRIEALRFTQSAVEAGITESNVDAFIIEMVLQSDLTDAEDFINYWTKQFIVRFDHPQKDKEAFLEGIAGTKLRGRFALEIKVLVDSHGFAGTDLMVATAILKIQQEFEDRYPAGSSVSETPFIVADIIAIVGKLFNLVISDKLVRKFFKKYVTTAQVVKDVEADKIQYQLEVASVCDIWTRTATGSTGKPSRIRFTSVKHREATQEETLIRLVDRKKDIDKTIEENSPAKNRRQRSVVRFAKIALRSVKKDIRDARAGLMGLKPTQRKAKKWHLARYQSDDLLGNRLNNSGFKSLVLSV